HLIEWRTMANWREIKGTWTKHPVVVGSINGASHEIYNLDTEPHEQFYSVSVITPYTAIQLARKPILEKVKCRKLIRRIRKYRVGVEDDIGKVKTYIIVSTLWRHPRKLLSSTVSTCASLVCSRNNILKVDNSSCSAPN
ncbi:hypothetical protein MAR_033090, partial [Mya arenaria]